MAAPGAFATTVPPAASESPTSLGAAPAGPPRLWLRSGIFDPAAEAPPIAPGLTLTDAQGHYIVQFDGPITPERSDWLKQASDVLSYLPDYAYVVRAASDAPLRSNPAVRYVGPFHPGYKLDPALGLSRDIIDMSVVCFEGADRDAVASGLEALGARVVSVDPLMIRVRSPGALACAFCFLPEVQWVQEYQAPELANYNAAKILRVRTAADGGYKWGSDALWSYNATSGKYEGYAGAGYTAAVVDTGVDGGHPAFNGKKVAYYSYGYANWYDYNGHGTHTSGSILGNGAYRAADPGTPGRYAGMAPLAGLVGQVMAGNYYSFCNDAVDSGAVVSSNSWGGGYWGVYDDSAASYDSLVRDSDAYKPGNQSISVCFSAGNDGYYGQGTISPPATAKNVIAVGATDDSSGTSLASFSSRGPTSDGRLKPDILAPGDGVTSCRANSAYSYVAYSGTSMSCPLTAGAVVLVNEYYNRTQGTLPSPAMVKNLLINGGDPMPGRTYPGNDQGWGRLNLAQSLLNSTNRKIWTEDQRLSLVSGVARNYIVNVTNPKELRVSVVWTDYCGTVNAAKALVNDLDLTVTAPNGTLYMGNVFSGGYSARNGTADSVNNVEMVRLAAPAPGRWVIDVRGRNVPRGAQDYSLVVGGAFDNVSVARLDLSASNVTVTPAGPAEGDSVTIGGSIENIGDLPVPAARYRFNVRGEDNVTRYLDSGEVPGLLAGDRATVSANWTAVRGCATVTVEVDPFFNIPEDDEANNDASISLTVRGYGLALSCDRPAVGIRPATTGNFSILAHNLGNTFDTFSLRMDSRLPAGWTASVETGSLPVPSGVNRSFNVSVVPPADALAGDYADFRVGATSEGNSTYTSGVDITATVDQVFDFFLSAASAEGWVLPGRMVTYSIGLDNAGNGRESVTLALAGAPEGWGAFLSGTFFILQPDERQNASLTVAAPPKAPALSSASITVEAVSGDSRRSTVSILTRASRVTGLELQLAEGPETAAAGTAAEFVIKVQNQGNGRDTFTLTAGVDEGWTYEFDGPAAEVRSGDFSLDTLTLTVPRGTPAGEHTVLVRAVSGADPATAYELELTIYVEQYFGVELSAEETQDKLETGNYSQFTIQVNNTGNGEDSFVLKADDSLPRTWRITVRPSVVQIPANGSVQVLVKVRPPVDVAEGAYTFNVVATSWGGPLSSASLKFKLELVKPPAPPAPPPLPPPTPQPEPPTPPARNRVIVWITDHRYLSLALLVLIIAAAAGGVYARSRRRKAPGAAPGMPSEAMSLTMAPSAYASVPAQAPPPPAPPIEWGAVPPPPGADGQGAAAPYPPPSGPETGTAPEDTLETLDMGPPAVPPPEPGPGEAPADIQGREARPGGMVQPASPPQTARRAVDDDIDAILARIGEATRK